METAHGTKQYLHPLWKLQPHNEHLDLWTWIRTSLSKMTCVDKFGSLCHHQTPGRHCQCHFKVYSSTKSQNTSMKGNVIDMFYWSYVARDSFITALGCKSKINDTKCHNHFWNVVLLTAPSLPWAVVQWTDSEQEIFKNKSAHKRCFGCAPFGVPMISTIKAYNHDTLSELVPNVAWNLFLLVDDTLFVATCLCIMYIPSWRNIGASNLI